MCSPHIYSARELAIAYAEGYEAGHHDTVEGCFEGNGDPGEHDELAWDRVQAAKKDGVFKRQLHIR